MADIFHYFQIKSAARRVFDAVTSSEGLSAWWAVRASGRPDLEAEYSFHFGPGYDWRAVVTKCAPNTEFEWQMTQADEDCQETRIGSQLAEKDGLTQVRFYHRGWPESNDHFRISNYCWAMYLRLLKRYLEHGEIVPYNNRLEV